jgi:hypothetical protein
VVVATGAAGAPEDVVVRTRTQRGSWPSRAAALAALLGATLVAAGCVDFGGCAPVPGGKPVGAACAAAEECRSLVCLPVVGVCSQECSERPCPAGTRCQDAGAHGHWCLPEDAPCVPRCADRPCGAADGCGGACPACAGERRASAPAGVEPPCRPHATRRCLDDDAWWFDGCGQPEQLIGVCPAYCWRGECVDCWPACDDRACGADPRCGLRCGECGPGAACVQGRCVPDGGDPCLGRECGPGADGRSCGACEGAYRRCDEDGRCVPGCDEDGDCGPAGRCDPATQTCTCAEGTTTCGGPCADLTRDRAHCGGCDRHCEPGTSCQDGRCVVDCRQPGSTCPAHAACDPTSGRCDCDPDYRPCVDGCWPLDDLAHCGFLCEGCPPRVYATAACTDGDCAYTCEDGYRYCQFACRPCPREGVAETRCDRAACVKESCLPGYRGCGPACAPCPAGAIGTACDGRTCVATFCGAGLRACGGVCVPCPAGAVETECVDGACVETPCEPPRRRCAGVCRSCPTGATATTCAGPLCAATDCAAGRRPCEGICAPCPADAELTYCEGPSCVAVPCPPPAQRACADGCAVCPTEGVAATGCDGAACVPLACWPGRRVCGGVCAVCPTGHVAATACVGGACVVAACQVGWRLCEGACARCPTEGVVATVCAGADCQAAACAAGYRRCAGRCAPCPTAGVQETACSGDRCVLVTCGEGYRECVEEVCVPCPTAGTAETRCTGGECVAASCGPAHRLCAGACAPCPEGVSQNTTCAEDACVPDCAAGERWCRGTCARCDVGAATATGCDGLACVALACAVGHRLCDGACAPCPEGALEPYCGADGACRATRCAGGYERCAGGLGCCPPCPSGAFRCAGGCCPWAVVPGAEGGGGADGGLSLALDADGRAVALVDAPADSGPGARLLREGPDGALGPADDPLPPGGRAGDALAIGDDGAVWVALDTPDGVIVRRRAALSGAGGAHGGDADWALSGPRDPAALAPVALVVAGGEAVAAWEEQEPDGGARLLVRDFVNGVWYPARLVAVTADARGFGRKGLAAGSEGTRVLHLLTGLPGEPARHHARRAGPTGAWTELTDDLPALADADVAFGAAGEQPQLCGAAPEGLVHAWHDGAGWRARPIAPGLSPTACTIATGGGAWHVTYGADDGAVGLVTWPAAPDGAPWHSVLVAGPDETSGPALAVDAQGRPRVAWWDATRARPALARAGEPVGD